MIEEGISVGHPGRRIAGPARPGSRRSGAPTKLTPLTTRPDVDVETGDHTDIYYTRSVCQPQHQVNST